jgi:hypothetical protein
MTNNFSLRVANKVLDLLDERKARLYDDRKTFYVWPRDGRLMIIFDAGAVDGGKVNDDFAHRLSTRLQGRRVVRTNSRGLFLQIGFDIPPAAVELTSAALDLSRQPSEYHMPIGSTSNGELWVSLLEGDSFLVAGSRGMGKTGFIHGCIQALLHGGKVEVYGFDGKRGVEFSRYIGHPMFRMVHSLGETLTALKAIAKNRRTKLLISGQPNIVLYNERNPMDAMLPIAIFVDEAALTNDEEKAALVQIVERERDTGFYPVLATNRPEAAALLVKTNLVTRICFPVPSWNASNMVLGMNGAESLPKMQGRGLIVFKARVSEFQCFLVTYPEPTEETVKLMLERDQAGAEGVPPYIVPTAENSTNEIIRLAESIRDQWSSTLSKRETAKLLGKTYAGWWATKIDQVIEYLGATTTTKGSDLADLSAEMA